MFWKRGYEGASLGELTQAMGINRPSLYAAFGNKEALFRLAVDRYVAKSGAMLEKALAAQTAKGAVERLLRGVAANACGKMRGCLLVQGALACGEGSEAVRRALAARRGEVEVLVRKRLERGQLEGELAKAVDVAALAKYVATFQLGMAVQAAGGATKEALLAAVAVAMGAWPQGGVQRTKNE